MRAVFQHRNNLPDGVCSREVGSGRRRGFAARLVGPVAVGALLSLSVLQPIASADPSTLNFGVPNHASDSLVERDAARYVENGTVEPTTTDPPPTAPPTFRPDPPETVAPTTIAPNGPTTTVPTTGGTTLAGVCGVSEGSGAGCRVIAYYGTPAASSMGILGRTAPAAMLASLRKTTAEWQAADPATPTRCALELITVVAQASPGPSGLYRGRAAPALIRKVIGWARSAGCLVILDVQVGWSTVAAEIVPLAEFLAEPDVHLALDPEWDMPPGVRPGTQIGTMDAADINIAAALLDRLVRERGTGPKMLVVHRFREFMVTNPKSISVTGNVRLVANMDGFGTPERKLDSYAVALRGMPTKLSGFKLFTKLDTPMLTPAQALSGRVQPIPVFFNYQ